MQQYCNRYSCTLFLPIETKTKCRQNNKLYFIACESGQKAATGCIRISISNTASQQNKKKHDLQRCWEYAVTGRFKCGIFNKDTLLLYYLILNINFICHSKIRLLTYFRTKCMIQLIQIENAVSRHAHVRVSSARLGIRNFG